MWKNLMNQPNEYHGYSLFHDVLSPKLKAWNRINIIFNIKEYIGNAVATKYAAQFDKADKIMIVLTAMKIQKNGYENTRREIMREMNA